MKALGIDIGGMSIKLGIVDENGTISKKWVLRPTQYEDQEKTICEIVESIKENCDETISGIGVGCPGAIDTSAGSCQYWNNHMWRDFLICPALSKEFGVPCKISNDANAAMLGEAKFGAGKGTKHCVLLTLGTGVGGGLYLDGKLFEGNEGKGAEIGHSVIKAGGRMCSCGRRGCLEAYASVSALIADTKKVMKKHPESIMWKSVDGNLKAVDGRTAFEASKLGDLAANQVVDAYIAGLGEGVLNILSVFRPERVLFGGGLSGQKEYLLNKLDAYLALNNYGYAGHLCKKPELVVSSLGNDAGILGAAALVLF